MNTLDDVVNRINAYFAAERITLRAASTKAGLHHNTVSNALRRRTFRSETLRRLEALVPVDFHVLSSSDIAEGAEQVDGCHTKTRSASENCDLGAR